MNILVIFTGGTIGSAINDGWISPNSETKYQLIELYKKQYCNFEIAFDTITPYYILSENLSATELTKLGKCISDNLNGGYDGIIVTHGTDTLQYTAAALSYMFGNANLPIVLVSSAYPLEHTKSNGVDNFNAAVNFIKSGIGKGVYVSYKNSFEGKVNIHAGTRLASHIEASADVYSIDNNPYAFHNNDEIAINEGFVCNKYRGGVGKMIFCEYPEILVVDCHPGDAFNYNPQDYKAVILIPFHSATLNTNNVKLKDFLNKASECNIPVFLINAPEGEQYETTKLYEELKINVLPMCTKSAIYMKCWIAISLGENITEFVKKSLSHEFIEKGDIK